MIGNAHPVSVMTGDAVWAGNQLILTMRIPTDQLLLHCHVEPDAEGYVFREKIAECELTFLEIVRKNFLLNIPENILPEVKELHDENIPEKVMLLDLHDYNYAFEIRFRCNKTPSEIVLKQTLGNYNRGLQSTALITFHLDGKPELLPLYNNLPVTIDLINNSIVDGKIQPILVIKDEEIEFFLPGEWTVHGLPFDVSFDGMQATGNLMDENLEVALWPGYRFQIPEGTSSITITWTNIVWQIRKVEMVVKWNTGEQTIVFSRFRPENRIELQ